MFAHHSALAARAARRVARNGKSRTRQATARVLGRLAAYGLTAALVVFHGQLLWQRIADLTVFEPLVALNWAFALLVLGGFVHLQRTGFPIFRGRKALILWLLVLMLHAGSLPAESPFQWGAESGLLVSSLWSFGLLIVLGLRLGLAGAPRLAAVPWGRSERGPDLPAVSGWFEPLCPRPPPSERF